MYDRGIDVKLLTSYWPHTTESQVRFVSSLAAINGTSKGSMETVGIATTQYRFGHDAVVGEAVFHPFTIVLCEQELMFDQFGSHAV